MKKIVFLILSLLLVNGLSAQIEADALRFSQTGLNGSSNYVARAGALGAVGGDLMSASFNPAGLGVYNSGEISFSSGLNWTFTDANHNGFLSSDDRANFNFGHFGVLFHLKSENETFKAVQLGFGVNRIRSFGNRTTFRRENIPYSFISNIIDEKRNDNFMEDFFQAYIVDYDTVAKKYTSIFQNKDVNQVRSFTESGSHNEMTFSLSTNIENFIYMGATIGVPMLNYHFKGSFTENIILDPAKAYVYNENVDIKGTGINLKIGTIIKPIYWFRFGLAVHTPTYYTLEDNLFTEASYIKHHQTQWGAINYDMQTPFKFLGSMAFVLGDNKSKIAGTLSADYEYADYSSMKYRLENNIKSESFINTSMKNMFQPAHTYRIGAEVKVGRIAFRGGYCQMTNPYGKDNNKMDYNDASLSSITAGLGYRTGNFFIDFAYAYTNGKSLYLEYDRRETKFETTNHSAQFTVGIKF